MANRKRAPKTGTSGPAEGKREKRKVGDQSESSQTANAWKANNRTTWILCLLLVGGVTLLGYVSYSHGYFSAYKESIRSSVEDQTTQKQTQSLSDTPTRMPNSQKATSSVSEKGKRSKSSTSSKDKVRRVNIDTSMVQLVLCEYPTLPTGSDDIHNYPCTPCKLVQWNLAP